MKRRDVRFETPHLLYYPLYHPILFFNEQRVSIVLFSIALRGCLA